MFNRNPNVSNLMDCFDSNCKFLDESDRINYRENIKYSFIK